MKMSFLSGDITLFKYVSGDEKMTFTKHMSVMLKSGIPLSEAIAIVEKQSTGGYFKSVLKKMRKELINGQEFYKTLSLFPHIFDSFYVQLVRVGEQSGTLEKNLDYLAAHLKKEHEFRSKILGAFMYPMIVLIIAFVAAMGLSIFVLPKLVTLFSSLGTQLPLTTRILLGFATLMQGYGLLVGAGVIAFIVLVRYILTRNAVKPYWHRLVLSFPFIGVFFQDIQLATFFRNMGIMLQGGIPIIAALDTQYDATANAVYKEYIAKLRNAIEKGRTMTSVFEATQFTYFPLIATHMLGVGERTGKLDETFEYLGEYFEDEVDDASRNFTVIVEPLILIVVGLIVGFIAFAIIGPIYQFTGSVQG